MYTIWILFYFVDDDDRVGGHGKCTLKTKHARVNFTFFILFYYKISIRIKDACLSINIYIYLYLVTCGYLLLHWDHKTKYILWFLKRKEYTHTNEFVKGWKIIIK